MLFAIFYYVASSADGVKAIMGKAAGAWARIKAGNHQTLSVILVGFTVTIQRKMSAALKNILKKQ